MIFRQLFDPASCTYSYLLGSRRLAGFDDIVISVCSYGEVSAMAVEIARDLGWSNCCHLTGGLNGWWVPCLPHVSVSGLSGSDSERKSS